MLRAIVDRLRGTGAGVDTTERMEPDFLIIGAQKSGTTALFDYLARHPSISAPEIKEIDFFNCDSRYGKGVGFYHSHFPATGPLVDGKLTFEASPGYLFNADAPGRIHEYNADLKLIAILRDPVERAYSAWNMYKKRYEKAPGWFVEWMKRCDEYYEDHPFAARDIENFGSFTSVVIEELVALEQGIRIEAPILKHGCYHEQIERYHGLFGRERLLIIENRTFKSETQKTLEQVECFLGLPSYDWSREDTSPVFEGGYDESISAEAREMLVTFYAPDNAKLYDMLGRTFSWENHGR